MEALCHLEGRILPLEEARISPLDRGFLFGDSLYEVVKVRAGEIFELDTHLDRLVGSLDRTGIGLPSDIARASEGLVAAAGLETGFLYIQVTRGVAPRTHLPPGGMAPTLFILPAEYEYDRPAGRSIRAITRPDPRWGHCDIKTTSLIATVLGKITADNEGADEILFHDEQGTVREGGQTNFFVRRDDRLETHPADRHILPGVTRQLLLRFAREIGLEVRERAPLLAERGDWQEAFICGTLTGVQPVVELDRQQVGSGEAGEWTQRLADANESYELAWLQQAAEQALTPSIGR